MNFPTQFDTRIVNSVFEEIQYTPSSSVPTVANKTLVFQELQDCHKLFPGIRRVKTRILAIGPQK